MISSSRLALSASLLAVCIPLSASYSQNVGIGTTTPDASALLDLTSSSTGLLIPRLASTASVASPATGLLVYNSTSNLFYYNAGSAGTPNWLPLLSSSSGWTTTGNSGTTAGTNFLGTTDAQSLIIKTNATERLRILSTGEVGVGQVSPLHALHVTSTTTTDEKAAIYGEVTGASTSNQMVGVWGVATNATSNTGSIGVLASGSGSSSAGATNVALQVSGGEIAVGRTTETGSYTVVEGAASGSGYSAEGPSGVIEIAPFTSDQTVTNHNALRLCSGLTVTNRYVTASSIILVQVLDHYDGTSSQSGNFGNRNVSFSTGVENRTTGSFDLTVDLINESGGTITVDGGASSAAKDKIRVGYVIINPGR